MKNGEKVEGIVLIPDPSEGYMNERQRVDYKNHRQDYIEWLANYGKDPEALEGYAYDTAKNYAAITDKFYRWVWETKDGYTVQVTHEDAKKYIRELVKDDYTKSHLNNVLLALKALFRWHSATEEWNPDIKLKGKSSVSQPKDFVTEKERRKLREASLEYGSVPAYAALDPEERKQWKIYLARRFGKAKKDVSPDDWKRANGFKYPSIVHASLDAGLRPIEVGRAKTYWVDVENAILRIPEDESSKNEENWAVSLRRGTADIPGRWLQERELCDKYDDTESLWLTHHNNPYSSSSLRVLLDNLCEIADINRDISWYTIRYSVGTYMA